MRREDQAGMAGKRYRVLGPIYDGQRRYGPGDEIVLDIAPDDALFSCGVIEPVAAAAGSRTESSGDPARDADAKRDAGPAQTDRGVRLLAAIGTLLPDNPDHWTKKGKPEVRALESLSALADVSAAERDAAWDAFRGDAQV